VAREDHASRTRRRRRALKLTPILSFLIQIRETLKTVDIDSSGRVELEDWVAVRITSLLSESGELESERARLPSELEADLDMFPSCLPSPHSLSPTSRLHPSFMHLARHYSS